MQHGSTDVNFVDISYTFILNKPSFYCFKALFLAIFTKFARLFVTLEESAGFLCIKAMQGIEKFLGYDIETVLNSKFCYRLPKRAPDSEPPPVS